MANEPCQYVFHNRARMVAQARLVEAYERSEWPRRAPTLPVLLAYIMDQHDLARADLVPLLGTASRVSGPAKFNDSHTTTRAKILATVRTLAERP